LTQQLLSSAKIVLSIVAVAFIGLLLNAQFQMKSDIAHYIELAEQFKLEAEAANKYADSLNIHILEQEERANAAIARAARLSREVQGLKADVNVFSAQALLARAELTEPIDIIRVVIPLQDSIIKKQDEIITTQGIQIGELNYAITEKNSTIELLTMSRDSLQTILRNPPPVPRDPNKLFGIKLPSRTTTAVVSFITGIIVTVVVLN
jgi:hypothetical protein